MREGNEFSISRASYYCMQRDFVIAHFHLAFKYLDMFSGMGPSRQSRGITPPFLYSDRLPFSKESLDAYRAEEVSEE